MKKLISLMLVGALSLTMLSSCSQSGSSAQGGGSGATVSEDWKPTKDISVIVAYKAGSGTDTGARILCATADKYVDETLVIVNKEGADGKIGYTELANAKPDGHTIGFINLPTYVSLASEEGSTFKKDSVVPIINHLFEPSVIAVRKDAPWNTIEELVEYCKANPGVVKASTNGVQASNHIGIQLFAKEAGIEITSIPYGGTADQLLALRQGEVDISSPKAGDVASLTSELKILGTYTSERLEEYPDVPTLGEQGYDIVYGSARALVAPAGTPQPIIDYYVDAFTKAMEDPENIEKSKNTGLSLSYMSPEELGAFIDDQEEFVLNVLPTLFTE